MHFKSKKFSFREHSGLEVTHLACKATIHSKGMLFDELLLKTPHSSLEKSLEFVYEHYYDMADFIDKVYIKSELVDTKIGITDLVYFSSDLKKYTGDQYSLAGNAKGTIENLKVNNLVVESTDKIYVAGDLKLKGLPEWASTYLDLDVNELRTRPSALNALLHEEILANDFDKLGNSKFSGHLTGFINEFAVDGLLQTELGNLNTRFHYRLPENSSAIYSGKLVSDNFNVGYLVGEPSIGTSKFAVKLDDVSGDDLETLNGHLEAQVDRIAYEGRQITNINAEGLFKAGGFTGNAFVKDPNIDLDFEGEMDFARSIPLYDFKTVIKRVDLRALNLDSTNSVLSGEFDINLKGKTLDEINGLATARDITLHRAGKKYLLNNFFLSSGYLDKQRSIILRSDFADVNLKGNFLFSQLDQVYADFLNTLFPEYYANPKPLSEAVVITTDVRIRNSELLALLIPFDLSFGNGTFVGQYDALAQSLAIDGSLDYLNYGEYKLVDHFINVRKKPFELLNMTTDAKELRRNDSLIVDKLELNASILPNDVDFLFNFSDTSNLLALRSFGHVHFSDDSIQLELEESKLYSSGRRWDIDNQNRMLFTNGNSIIQMLQLRSGNESAFVTGKLSASSDHKLSVWLSQFQLSNLNPLLKDQDIELSGFSNGSLDIYQVLNRPSIKANLLIDQLAFNGDTLGNFKIISSTAEQNSAMDIQATIQEGLFKNLLIEGRVDWSDRKNNFNLNMSLKDGGVKFFESIFLGMASDFSGLIDANLKLRGTFEEPKISGYVDLKKVKTKVDYLGTFFTLNNRVKLTETVIDVSGVSIEDIDGNKAKAKGEIRHNLFDDFFLDLAIVDAQNFLALDTKKEDNSLFYGKAYASGFVSFKGDLNDIFIKIDAKSTKGTKIHIPVYSDEDNSLVDYITFIQPGKKQGRKRKQDVQGITMDMAFQITEDAQFELIFDELLDDKISGSGKGSVKMELTPAGDFFMFGDFEISQGSYPFSSPMLVSEKFVFKKGGKIRWDGDPYNAHIDMEATIRRNKANPYHLMLGSGFIAGQEDKYKGEVVVDVELFLKGELFSPDISFGLSLPDNTSISGSSEFLSVLNRVREDEDELNRQVFSLVTFGSFSPTNYGDQHSAGNPGSDIRKTVNNSLSSFLSGQINNWISQYDQNWEIGVDWQAQSVEQNAELILSIRRKVFNDRLELAGSVDAYANKGGVNPYNVNLIYNVKKDGKIRLKAFQKLANDPTLGEINNVTTTGVGFFFRTQFDRIRFRKKPEIAKE
jgi:hypothetical protein